MCPTFTMADCGAVRLIERESDREREEKMKGRRDVMRRNTKTGKGQKESQIERQADREID